MQQTQKQIIQASKAHLKEQINAKFDRGLPRLQQWTDIPCFVVLILICILFLVFTIVFLSYGGSALGNLKNDSQQRNKDLYEIFPAVFCRNSGTIVGMIVLALSFALVILVFISKFPQCTLYTILASICVIECGILAVLGVWGQFLFYIIFLPLLFYHLFKYCWNKKQLLQSIVLLRVSGYFLIQNPKILIIMLISVIINVLFLIFFVLGWVTGSVSTMTTYNQVNKVPPPVGMMVVYYIITILLSYFFYYLETYVIASAVKNIFFQQQAITTLQVLQGYVTVGKHLGSLAVASIVITFSRILYAFANDQIPDFCVLHCILSFIKCTLSKIRPYIETANHNAVIVMSLTGQSYIDSVKSTIGLVSRDMKMFRNVEFLSNFIQFHCLAFCLLLSSFIGAVVIYPNQTQANYGSTSLTAFVIIFFLCWIVCSVALAIIQQILPSLLIMSCLQRQFEAKDQRISDRVPLQILEVFFKDEIERVGLVRSQQVNDNDNTKNHQNHQNHNHNQKSMQKMHATHIDQNQIKATTKNGQQRRVNHQNGNGQRKFNEMNNSKAMLRNYEYYQQLDNTKRPIVENYQYDGNYQYNGNYYANQNYQANGHYQANGNYPVNGNYSVNGNYQVNGNQDPNEVLYPMNDIHTISRTQLNSIIRTSGQGKKQQQDSQQYDEVIKVPAKRKKHLELLQKPSQRQIMYTEQEEPEPQKQQLKNKNNNKNKNQITRQPLQIQFPEDHKPQSQRQRQIQQHQIQQRQMQTQFTEQQFNQQQFSNRKNNRSIPKSSIQLLQRSSTPRARLSTYTWGSSSRNSNSTSRRVHNSHNINLHHSSVQKKQLRKIVEYERQKLSEQGKQAQNETTNRFESDFMEKIRDSKLQQSRTIVNRQCKYEQQKQEKLQKQLKQTNNNNTSNNTNSNSMQMFYG